MERKRMFGGDKRHGKEKVRREITEEGEQKKGGE